MRYTKLKLFFLIAFFLTLPEQADAKGIFNRELPFISYVNFESAEPLVKTPIPFEKSIISGQFRVPLNCADEAIKCPAVVIIHSSFGVDSKGMFYSKAFNRAGIATLEIDIFAPRGWHGGIIGRPNSPAEIVATLADAYGALAFLSDHRNIDPERIAIMGFSFGGVLSMLSATSPYTELLAKNSQKFSAHIGHYPICWVYNVVPGAEFVDFTGAPILIQVGEGDGYHDPETCPDLVDSLPEETQQYISLNMYRKATHEFDRLQPKTTVFDPFACFGEGCQVSINPRKRAAYRARRKAVRFLNKAFQFE